MSNPRVIEKLLKHGQGLSLEKTLNWAKIQDIVSCESSVRSQATSPRSGCRSGHTIWRCKKTAKPHLASAYHQLLLEEGSNDPTTFITHEGLFRFKRVCFGLVSVPAVFQKMMSQILKNCKNMVCYLDIVAWESEHDASLIEVLTCTANSRPAKSFGLPVPCTNFYPFVRLYDWHRNLPGSVQKRSFAGIFSPF